MLCERMNIQMVLTLFWCLSLRHLSECRARRNSLLAPYWHNSQHCTLTQFSSLHCRTCCLCRGCWCKHNFPWDTKTKKMHKTHIGHQNCRPLSVSVHQRYCHSLNVIILCMQSASGLFLFTAVLGFVTQSINQLINQSINQNNQNTSSLCASESEAQLYTTTCNFYPTSLSASCGKFLISNAMILNSGPD